MLDSNPSMRIPLGFRGSISLPNHGPFVFFPELGSRVYHPLIVQFLNPDWEPLLADEMRSPFELFAYRFRNNDPINVDGAADDYMAEAGSWLALFGLDVKEIMFGRDLRDINGPLTPQGRHLICGKEARLEFVSGFETALEGAERSLSEISFVRKAAAGVDASRNLVLNRRLTSSPIAFGPGFLLSVVDSSTAVVNVVDGVQPGGVIQKIFESVLNGSAYLSGPSFDQTPSKSVYYFSKPSVKRFRIDMDAVNRLAGEFEVAVRDLDKGSKDLRIENEALVVHVIYGGGGVEGRHGEAILAEQAAQAAKLAWAREGALVAAGFRGSRDWSKAQRAELAAGRRVKGFLARSPASGDYSSSSLARDASNYAFMDASNSGGNGGGHRRRSRHGKARSRH